MSAEKQKIFISILMANPYGDAVFDENAMVGDVHYPEKLAALLTEAGIDCEFVRGKENEDEVFDYVKKQTPEGVQPILHIMTNSGFTGFKFTPKGLQEFKENSGAKLVVTAFEIAKGNAQRYMSQQFKYLNVADQVLFLDEIDKNDAKNKLKDDKYSEIIEDSNKIENAAITRVLATVKLSNREPEARGDDILYFGKIHSGKGFGYQKCLAEEIKNRGLDKTIHIVGSVLKKDSPYELRRLMIWIYPEKEEEIIKQDNVEELIALLDEYEGMCAKGELVKQLPIKLHLNLPESELPSVCDQCKYAFLPLYRGTTLRNSSMNTVLANRYILFSTANYNYENRTLTPCCLLDAGKYADAVRIFKKTIDSGDIGASLANFVLDGIEDISSEGWAKTKLFGQLDRLVEANLNEKRIVEQHKRIYDAACLSNNGSLLRLC